MRTRNVLLFLGCVTGAFVLGSQLGPRLQQAHGSRRQDFGGKLQDNNPEQDTEKVDLTSDDSFPASDPPSWSSSISHH